MFQGHCSFHVLANGAATLPAPYALQWYAHSQGALTLTRHPEGCLLVYSNCDWAVKRERVAALPASARALQRLLLGHAQDVSLSKDGQMTLPAELAGAAGIQTEAVLVGLGGHCEIWDACKWAQSQEDVPDALLVEQLADFAF